MTTDSDIEIEPKTRHSTSVSEPGEVDEPREYELEFKKYRDTQLNLKEV